MEENLNVKKEIYVNDKLVEAEEFEALKADPKKKLKQVEENKFRLLEKMFG